MGLTGVFASTSTFMGCAGLGIFIVYNIWGREWEKQVVAEKKLILDEMEYRRRRSMNEIKREDSVSKGKDLSTKL